MAYAKNFQLDEAEKIFREYEKLSPDAKAGCLDHIGPIRLQLT
jgi:hypothetical protein